MAKILLMILAFIIIASVAVAMHCAMVVTGRYDEQANMGKNEKVDKMFLKKQICSRCKTGKYTYDLDPKSECCPYIGCWKRNKCPFYKPLDNPSKTSMSQNLKQKGSKKNAV